MIIDRMLRPRDPSAEVWRLGKRERGLPFGLLARCAVTVFAVLPMGATWPQPLLVGFFALLLAGFLVDRYLPLPRWVYFVIRFLAWLPVAYVFVALYWLDTSIFAVIGNTLAAWILLYSFEATRRDYTFSMLMMGGLLLLLASLLRRDSVLLAGFVVYALGFIPALADAAWHAASNRHRAVAADRGWSGTLALSAAGLLSALLALLLGGALFVFMPRLESDFLRGVGINNIYQRSMPVFRIGGGARPLDWRPVMRVRTDAPGNYRGQVFVFYGGRMWSTISDKAFMPMRRNAQGDALMPGVWQQHWRGGTHTVRQEFEVLPGFSTNLRYHRLAPLSVASDDRDLRARPDGMINGAQRSGFSYRAVSQVAHSPLARARGGEEPLHPKQRGMYLQLPAYHSKRVAALAREIAGQGDDYVRANRLSNWLKENCEYDLAAATPLLGADMLDYFLFTSRAGWCEHFATALAVMCRHAGIPSRLVTGFAEGEYDPLDGSYLVRALHAHAWTEVYLAGRGWYTFDATPAGAFPAGTEPGMAGSDWRSAWPDRMLKFIDSDQAQLEGMALQLVPVPDVLGEWTLAAAVVPLLMLLAGAVLLVTLLVLWRRRARRQAVAVAEIVRLYDRIRAALAAAGAQDAPGWTPRRFAAQDYVPADPAWAQVFAALAELTEAYYRCRFANAPDGGLLARLRALVRTLPRR